MEDTFKDIDELERLFVDEGEEEDEKPAQFSRGREDRPPIAAVDSKKSDQTNSFKERPKTDGKITHFYESSGLYTDPVFGLRILKPLISSKVLLERMENRIPVTFARLKSHVEHGDKSKDWVIAGVIVSKMVKTSQKGTKYTLWKLSDLKNDIKMVSVMLFKAAHSELWKTTEGTVVAILNPGIMESKEGGKDEATLSVDSTPKIMILGNSKDMGKCKSKTKTGDPCPAVVNVTDCEYCIYHVKQEYGRASGRSELQSSTAGRGLNELRNKILGKNEVFYAGQSYTAIPAKKNPKRVARDEQRLLSLSQYYKPPTVTVPAAQSHPKVKAADRLEINQKQRQKDIERLAILKGENIEPISFSPPIAPSKLKPVVESKPSVFGGKSSLLSVTKLKSKSATSTPSLSITQALTKPSLSQSGFSFDLNISSKLQAKAKARAVQVIQQKPIDKVDPNSVHGTAGGKKRALENLNRSFEDPEVKRSKIDEETARKNRILEIMNTKSSHTDLVEMKERQIQDKYFSNLEKKEAMEEKMMNTTKVACKAVICLQCKYVALSAAERCKAEGHPLKIKDAEKRFFKCKDCGNRTVTVQRLPKLACKSCNGSRWERTGMMKEKQVAVGEQLSIRGDEEAWLGQSGPINMNLLVPEET